MKTFAVMVLVLMASPAAAQNTSARRPASAAARVDPCAPIGRTADGRFVYGMACENLPVPVAPPRAQNGAPTAAATAPVEEEDQGGLFKNPFPSFIRPSNVERQPGLGPAGAR